MKTIITILTFIFISCNLQAGQLALYKVSDELNTTDFHNTTSDNLKNRSWRHPAELYNIINYIDNGATYFYLITTPEAKYLKRVVGALNKGIAEEIVRIDYDKYGYKRDTAEWTEYKDILNSYKAPYVVDGGTETQ